jgi:eukaryotic-like serine/threonine-protein kinase
MESLRASDPPRIGPYGLLGRLGSGGMGRVYLGRSAGGRLVAVKVIRPELADEPGFRARFAREVAVARTVSGLFTAAVVDADVSGPVPWLATAYVAGASLADQVGGKGPLPVTSVLALAAGLAEGLGAIHAAGVVHRDLKPENVLLADDGPRLIDFGISRAAQTSRLTQTGTVMGSPGFMSPEQAEGRAVGPASDVFSLGAVLTFAATGEGPFGTGSTPALVYRVIHHRPQTSRLPGQIRLLVERCLAKDPRQRPATAELLAELGAGGPAGTVLARPGSGGAAGTALAELGSSGPTGDALAELGSSEPTGTALADPPTAAPTRDPADPGSLSRALTRGHGSPSPVGGSAQPPTATVARSWLLPTEMSFSAPPAAVARRPPRRSRRSALWALLAAGLIAVAAAALVVPRAIGDAPASHGQRTTAARNVLSSPRRSPSTTPRPVPPPPVTMASSPDPAPTGSVASSPSASPAPTPPAMTPTPAPTTPANPTPSPTMMTPTPAATPVPTAGG